MLQNPLFLTTTSFPVLFPPLWKALETRLFLTTYYLGCCVEDVHFLFFDVNVIPLGVEIL